MDSSYSLLLDTLRAMESRLEAVIVGHGAEPEFRVASTEQRAAEHAGNTNLHINLDDAPVFDTDPADRVAATGIQFAQSGSERRVAESEQRAAVYAGDEVPIFDAEFTVFDQEPDDFTTMCSSVVFNAKFAVYDEQLVFDAEYAAHEEPVFHNGPLFDEESAVYDTEPVFDVPKQQPDVLTTACIDFVFDDEPVFDMEPFHDVFDNLTTTSRINTTMVDLDTACSPAALFPPSSTSTIIDASAKCSMKCLSNGVEEVIVAEPTQQKSGGSQPPAVPDPPPLIAFMVFNIYCSSIGDRGERLSADSKRLIHVYGVATASQMGFQSVLLASVVADGFEVIQCCDPGLPNGSTFIEIARPCDGFHWDPGALEGLQSIGLAAFDPAYHHDLHIDESESKLWDPGLADRSRFIEFIGLGSDFLLAQLGWFPMVLWLQQKCGGTDRIVLEVVWAKSEDFANALDIALACGGIWTRVFNFSEAVMLGAKFTKSMTIRSVIQGRYMLMLDISRSPYSFPAITVADRLYVLFPLSEYTNSQMANAAKAVSKLAMVFQEIWSQLTARKLVPIGYFKEGDIIPGYILAPGSTNAACMAAGDWKMVQKGLDRLVLTVYTTEAMQCLNNVIFIWVISSMGAVMLNSCVLTAYQVSCIALYFVQISVLGQNTKQSEMEYVPCLLFAAAIAVIVATVEWQNGSHFADDRVDRAHYACQLLSERNSCEGILSVMHWSLGFALLYTFQEIKEHWCFIMSATAWLSETFSESFSITNSIQDHLVPMLVASSSSSTVIVVTVVDKLYGRALWYKSLPMHMAIGDQSRHDSQFMSASWQNHCLVFRNMLSEKSEDCVLLLYQWNQAKFQLANSCHLMEYTLFSNVLQHFICSCAHILAPIVINPQLLSDWENQACRLSSDHKDCRWDEAESHYCALFSDMEVQWQLIVEPWHSSLNLAVPLIRADQMSVFHFSEPRLHFAWNLLSAAMSLSNETSKAHAVVLSYSEWLAALYYSVIGRCPAVDMLEVLLSLPVWWSVLCGMKTVVPVLLCCSSGLLRWSFCHGGQLFRCHLLY